MTSPDPNDHNGRNALDGFFLGLVCAFILVITFLAGLFLGLYVS